MRYYRKCFLILLIFLCNQTSYSSEQFSDYIISHEKQSLYSAWHESFPYMYYQYTRNQKRATGIDIKLLNFIKQKININIRADVKDLPLSDQLNLLKEGKIDFFYGTNYYEDLEKYVYYSVPYRMKDIALFKLKENNDNNLSFSNIEELLAQIRLNDYKVGILYDYIFSNFNSPALIKFLKDPHNKDIVIKYSSYNQTIKALLNKEIDYFIGNYITVASILFSDKSTQFIEEINIDVQSPAYFVFNKKQVSYTIVKKFNDVIVSKEFNDLLKYETKKYLYPILLLTILKSFWFHLLFIISIITFSISGVIRASKKKSSIFASFLLACIPSSVGEFLYNTVIHTKTNLSAYNYSQYLYITIITVLIIFSSIRLLNSFSNDKLLFLNKFSDHIIIICDSIGQSVIIIISIAFAIISFTTPLSIFVPLYTFLFTYGGVFLRDVIINKDIINTLSKTIHAEISIILGIIFIQLIRYYNFNLLELQSLVIITMCSFFSIRMLVYYFKIPNLRFY